MKKRIIASLILRNGWVVQSIGFNKFLPVGRAEIAARYLSEWDVDEIFMLDIDAWHQGRTIDPQIVRQVSDAIFVPLTVGGGITSVDDVTGLLAAGADKVSVGRLAVRDPDVVEALAGHFGSQCVVACVDHRITEGVSVSFVENGTVSTGLRITEHAKMAANCGAGEILLNDIERDGARIGFNIDAVKNVVGSVTVPVVCMGGAGTAADFVEALAIENISGVAAANFFHYFEHSVSLAKAYVRQREGDVRSSRIGNYEGFEIGLDTRLNKLDEHSLETQIFEYSEDLVI